MSANVHVPDPRLMTYVGAELSPPHCPEITQGAALDPVRTSLSARVDEVEPCPHVPVNVMPPCAPASHMCMPSLF